MSTYSLPGVTFIAGYHKKGGKPGENPASLELSSASSRAALLKWAQDNCPAGKELSVITCSGGKHHLSNAIWWKDSGFDMTIVRLAFH